jgi:hypothetical protein
MHTFTIHKKKALKRKKQQQQQPGAMYENSECLNIDPTQDHRETT